MVRYLLRWSDPPQHHHTVIRILLVSNLRLFCHILSVIKLCSLLILAWTSGTDENRAELTLLMSLTGDIVSPQNVPTFM